MNFFLPYRKLIARTIGGSPPIMPDIKAWASGECAGELLGSIGDSETIHRTHPTVVEGKLPSKFTDDLEYPIFERPVVHLSNVKLRGLEGFLKLDNGSVVLQTVWHPRQVILNPNYYKRSLKPVVQKPGTYFSFLLYWSTQYYHWLTEGLPLLHGMKEFLPPAVNYIIPGPPSRFHLESMELLGIEPDQCVIYDGKGTWELETMIFAPPATTCFRHLSPREIHAARYVLHHPTHFNGPFNHSPEAIRWLSETLVDSSETTSGSPSQPSRIYISRSAADCRRIVNEEALAPLLAEHGIATYHLESLSLADQVRLFHGAELVIGPHGAGLSNIMFCKPGTRVIELFEPSVIRLCYWSLSSIMQLPYTYFFGEAKPVPKLDPDIRVDVKEFACLLQKVLQTIDGRI